MPALDWAGNKIVPFSYEPKYSNTFNRTIDRSFSNAQSQRGVDRGNQKSVQSPATTNHDVIYKEAFISPARRGADTLGDPKSTV